MKKNNMENYIYLKRHIRSSYHENVDRENNFYPVSKESILKAESMIGRKFPESLNNFYTKIGYGFLDFPEVVTDDYRFCNVNRLNDPISAAELYNAVLDFNVNPNFDYDALIEAGTIISDETLELLSPGDLPFFEMYDSSHFLIMKLHSENPNAVWTPSGIKIEDSFEKFIWRLYYESPSYYGDIIEAHYAEMPEY